MHAVCVDRLEVTVHVCDGRGMSATADGTHELMRGTPRAVLFVLLCDMASPTLVALYHSPQTLECLLRCDVDCLSTVAMLSAHGTPQVHHRVGAADADAVAIDAAQDADAGVTTDAAFLRLKNIFAQANTAAGHVAKPLELNEFCCCVVFVRMASLAKHKKNRIYF